ncbi:MAG: dihydroorotase [Sumerlaeia bacterium]
MQRILIHNGIVADPSQGLHDRLDLLIEDGRIAEVAKDIPRDRADRLIDAQGFTISPGFIDLHTHLREPGGEGSETIETGSRAAAAGGFTTIYCMPNTNPVCDTRTGVQFVVSRAETSGIIRVIPVASVTRGQKGEELAEFGALLETGAGAFSDDGHPVMNANIMRRALACTRMLGVPIFDHAEDMDLTGAGVMHEGPVSLRLGLPGIPRISESTIVARDIALADETGGHIHICHVSARESVEAIREGKRNGIRVTAEVSPHHLTMTDEAVIGYNTHAKMKPPLNAEEDRQALIAALEDGTIDCVATDHAPHAATTKLNVFDGAPYGIIGMETAFPVLYTDFVATGQWSLEFLIEKMALAPARIMEQPWGTLRPGSLADLTLLDLNCEYTFEERHLRSKSSNCPWLGKTMKARIAATLLGGEIVFTNPDCFSVEREGAAL